MKVVSLFSGIGGFDLACERLDQTIVWANEYNKYAADIYDKHFNTKADRRDITTVPASDIPDCDIVVGGFPCQAFSVAGKRRGFADTRGTLFFDIARILNEKHPRYLLLENVKGLLSHDGGRTFYTIIATLDELGYDLQWQVCNSKDFGVPQNRERVFIVGHLRGQSRPEVFPIGGSVSQDTTSLTSQETGQDRFVTTVNDGRIARWIETDKRIFAQQGDIKSSTVQEHIYHKEVDTIDALSTSHQPKVIQSIKIIDASYPGRDPRIYSKTAPTVRDYGSGGNKMPMVTVPMQWRRTEKGKEYRRESQNKGRDYTPFSDGYRELVPKDSEVIGTITSQAIAKDSLLGVVKPEPIRVRRLTPTECERLQGFPDGWTAEGINGTISDTQRYKCLGNAVTVNVVEAIIRKLV